MKKFISDYLIPTYTEVFKIIMAICLFLFACIIIALVIFTALNWCILKIGVTWGVILGGYKYNNIIDNNYISC